MSLLSTGYAQFRPVCLILLVGLIVAAWSATLGASGFLQLEIGGEVYRIQLAISSAERRQGLMHRRHLDRLEGMLLVYRRSGDHRIWMKNVLIPLRVYWIDENHTVLDMQRLEPCLKNPCPVYSQERVSKYVLELSDHDHALAVGDRLAGLSEL